MSAPVITVEGLGKRYTLHHQARSGLLRDQLASLLRNPFRRQQGTSNTEEEFWALKDVNFTVNQGDVLGIIGRNGAGKSTLLKILSRITEPTTGRITIHGRVASLLEVGTGFHSELSGRENIFLNGAILGMTRAEIRKKFDEIVAFSEVEKFLDTPVKHYSSGMYVRLAFAVAAHLEPEILIVDEVLAVGDAAFQKKCLGKMKSIAGEEGRTVLFVSHNSAAIARLCTKGLVLQKGRIAQWGGVNEALAFYLASTNEPGETVQGGFRIIDSRFEILSARVNDSDQRSITVPAGRDRVTLQFEFTTAEPMPVSIEVRLLDQFGACIGFFCPGHADPEKNVISFPAGRHALAAELRLPALHRGTYQLDLAFVRPGTCYYARAENFCTLRHEGTPMPNGAVFDQSVQGAGYQVLSATILQRSDETA